MGISKFWSPFGATGGGTCCFSVAPDGNDIFFIGLINMDGDKWMAAADEGANRDLEGI